MRPRKSRYDDVVLKPATAVEDFSQWRGVWVIAEQRESKVRDVTFELLSAARPMADKLGAPVTAVLLCSKAGEMPAQLVAQGADEVIVVQHRWLKTALARPSADVLTELIQQRRPEIVLIGATHTGRDISSRIAVTVEAGMTADCTELDVEPDSRELLARRPAFGGKMLATIRCDRHRPQMATARPGIFLPMDADDGRTGKVEHVEMPWLDDRVYAAEVLDHVVEEGVDITKEDVLVAGGLGVGPDGWGRLLELAEALGGEVACTRPVADAGWQERSRQVGQTGISVRPKLYIAVGVSGAIQHIEGMKESGTVIAINSDPNAGIFQYADIGIVGDWRPAVDALIVEAKSRGLAQATWKFPQKDTLADDRAAAAQRAEKAGVAKTAPPAEAAPAATKPAAKEAGKTATQETAKRATKEAGKEAAKPLAPEAPAENGSAEAKAADPHAAPAATNGTSSPDATAEPAPEAPDAPGAAPEQTGPENGSSDGTYSGDPNDREQVMAWVEKHVPDEKKAWVLGADCIVCNGCEAACPTGAAIVTDTARVDRDICIADGACFDACPTDAIRPGIEDREESTGWPEGSRLAGQFGV